MAVQELVDIKFRLADGSDIGPNKYSPSSTVGFLKEKIISQWPKGYYFFKVYHRLRIKFLCF